MDDVKVHFNSSKPAQLNAHAYAQGRDIHLASGQERHLPHEAWHVVQQKQGRVKPTMQMKGTVNINDEAGLEKEADVMGHKSMQLKSEGPGFQWRRDRDLASYNLVIQRRPINVEVTWGVTHLVRKVGNSLFGKGGYKQGEIGAEGELTQGQQLIIDNEKTFRSRRGANQDSKVNRKRDMSAIPTVIWYHVLLLNGKNISSQKIYVRSGTFKQIEHKDYYHQSHPLNETRLKEGLTTTTYKEGDKAFYQGGGVSGQLAYPRHPPTETFFKDRGSDFKAWSAEDLKALPLKNIIAKEKEMLDTHLPLYHGQSLSHWANTYFINTFIQKAYLDPELTGRFWFRNPFDDIKPRFASVTDRDRYLKDSNQQLSLRSGKTDNDPHRARELLSVNPSVMQNSDLDAQESTADFVFSNMSVLKPSETNTLVSLFMKLGLSSIEPSYSQAIDKLVDQHLSVDSARGVLYQILIPHKEVRDLVYISGKNGIPDTSNPDSLKTLLEMQVPSEKGRQQVPNKKSLQARILMSPLMDPRRKTGVQIVPYFDKNPEVQKGMRIVMKEIDRMVNALRHEIKNHK
jgi:hypothetical protein